MRLLFLRMFFWVILASLHSYGLGLRLIQFRSIAEAALLHIFWSTMNHLEYAQQIQELLQRPPENLPSIIISDDRSKNAGRCMTALACN